MTRESIPPIERPGLSDQEARERLLQDGPNSLPEDKRKSLLRTVLEILREPMLLLLLGGGGLYLILGDLREALTLLSFVGVVIGITIAQERKTERALTALRDLSSPRALVIREGRQLRIPGFEVVRGDLLVLGEGDRVPADAILRDASHFEVDESLLTGESVPVRKRAIRGPAPDVRPGGDDLPLVYSGTLIVRGRGVAEVLSIGVATELGKIGRALREIEAEHSPMQQEVRHIVRTVALIGAGLCLLLVLSFGLTRGDWLRGLLAGIALAMAVLPEEFPVVLTVFLALGAWRIAKSRVLTRHMPALETLGSATVLCTDKTGTLTENRMKIAELWTASRLHEVTREPLPEEVHETLEFGILASQRDPFDPTEIAFKDLGETHLRGTEHLHGNWALVREYPLSPALLAMSHVWRAPEGDVYVVAAKGAPEAIADICHLDPAATERLAAATRTLAKDGLRVLAVARSYFHEEPLPPEQHDFVFELLGLVGLADPVRATVPPAVRECKEAGIRVLMITGDYPETAQAIARQIDLPRPDTVLTGAELDRIDDVALGERLEHTSIVARAVPEQKLRIVNALKRRGELVAMTGDGVNDAPALKAAHIGVAMGGRGTDVAREAAAVVLTDDDFSSIVAAVRLGRRIFENLQRAMGYILAIHVPIAGMSLIPALLGWPMALDPVHIVFLELMIDPACSIAFEAEAGSPGLMRSPPRKAGGGIFERRIVILSVLQGAGLLLATLLLFGLRLDGSAEIARAMAFTALIWGNITLIMVNRGWTVSTFKSLLRPNLAAWAVSAGAGIFLLLVLYTAPLRDLFRMAALTPADLVTAALTGVVSLAWFEVLKVAKPGWLAARTPAVIASGGG